MTVYDSKTFLVVSVNLVGVLNDPQALFDELYLRENPSIDVIRLSSIEEANILAFQRYGIVFHGYSQKKMERPMRLPVAGEFLLSPTASNAQDSSILPPTVMGKMPPDFGGVWGISALNGFGGGFGLSDMVGTMLSEKIAYPEARWFQNYPLSLAWSRYEYVRRFYSHFSGNSISPRVPLFEQMAPGRLFIDSEFESNEKQRPESEVLKKMQDVGLII